jgi:hypothetical protein
MREAPLEVEGRRDNLAAKIEKLCLIHQFCSGDLADITEGRPISGDHALQSLEENYGPRLVDLHVSRGIGVDKDESDPRICRPTVTIAALVAKPGLPVLFI